MGNDEERLGEILPRMNESHWAALLYVEKYGMIPRSPISDIAASFEDLVEWDLVTYNPDTQLAFTTDLGDLVLEEEPTVP